MSNENPNNTPQWRSKLDKLEHFPGSAFNSDVAWDKLYGRLEGKKKSKKILWYWIPAACLLFVVMITILNYQRPTPQVLNKETVKEQPKEIKKSVLKVGEINENKKEAGAETKNGTVSIPERSRQRDRSIAGIETVTKVHSDEVIMSDPEKEPFVKPLQIINTNPTIAVLPKKKLNVVHINELGDPIIESSDLTRIEDIHSFKLKFGNGEVLSNSAVVSKPSGFIILKTKTASN